MPAQKHKNPTSTRLRQLIGLIFLISIGSLTPANADDNNVQWLQTELGSHNALGEEVLAVSRENGTTVVDVRLPQKLVRDYEEVIVIGKKPNTTEKPALITLVKAPQWLHNDENEPYGLRFYVAGVNGFEFRIQLKAAPNQE